MWLGRDGKTRPISRDVRDFQQARLSPDGRRIAALVGNGPRSDVWIQDLETGTFSRLTSSENVTSVEWMKDGRAVVFSAAAGLSRAGIWAQSVESAAPPKLIGQLHDLSPIVDVSPDGRSLLVQSLVESDWDLLRLSADSGSRAEPFGSSKGNEFAPRFSPDGRWAAIVSDESGIFEVYVRSYPEPTAKMQVSIGGGSAPVWSADGTRLYYLAGTSLVEARLVTAPALRVVGRDTAFASVNNALAFFGQSTFDITRDGSRLVVPVLESNTYQLVVVPNWLVEFRQRMAASKR
jgi:Tol biopolymer transport system component